MVLFTMPFLFYLLLVEHVERERWEHIYNTILQHIRASISMSCSGGVMEGERREASRKFTTSLCTKTKKFYERNK